MIPIKIAREIEAVYRHMILPYVELYEIAGSIRRERAEVKDIEICVKPKGGLIGQPLLFSNDVTVWQTNDFAFTNHFLVKGCEVLKNGERYKQILTPENIKIDLFICIPPSQWGLHLQTRTGNRQFSRLMVTKRSQGGLMPDKYIRKDSRLYDTKIERYIEVPNEMTLFQLYSMKYIQPQDREY